MWRRVVALGAFLVVDTQAEVEDIIVFLQNSAPEAVLSGLRTASARESMVNFDDWVKSQAKPDSQSAAVIEEMWRQVGSFIRDKDIEASEEAAAVKERHEQPRQAAQKPEAVGLSLVRHEEAQVSQVALMARRLKKVGQYLETQGKRAGKLGAALERVDNFVGKKESRRGPAFGFDGDWLKKLDTIAREQKVLKGITSAEKLLTSGSGTSNVLDVPSLTAKRSGTSNLIDIPESRPNSLLTKDGDDGPIKWLGHLVDALKTGHGKGSDDWAHRLADVMNPRHRNKKETKEQRKFFDELRDAVSKIDPEKVNPSLLGGDWLDKASQGEGKADGTPAAPEAEGFSTEWLKKLSEAAKGMPTPVKEEPGVVAPVFGGDWLKSLVQGTTTPAPAPTARGPVV